MSDDENPLCAECSPWGQIEEQAYEEWEANAYATGADDDEEDYGGRLVTDGPAT